MIAKPERTGFQLTLHGELLYNDWKELGGCRCWQGMAPCSQCTHEGHPYSLEETDEYWEPIETTQEIEMSRTDITHVSDTKLNTTKEEIPMTQRKVVTVQLFDDSKGLPVEASLVAIFPDVVTEDDNETTIREVIMNNNIKSILDEHNLLRSTYSDNEILERTGNEVKLRPIELKNLRWKVVG